MKIKKFCSLGILLSQLLGVAFAQNITNVEYFIDNDPGYGSATAITITPATTINNLTINFTLTNALSDGFHRFHIRAKDDNNQWSIVASHPFLKTTFDYPPNLIPNITRVEYYIDSDPGYGLATNLSIASGTSITGLSVVVPIDNALTDGFHRFHIRAKDDNNQWTVVANHPFLKTTFSNPPNPIPNIVKAEYFIDTDPGIGNAINIPLTSSTLLNNLSINVDLAGLALGNHKLYVRAKDANNQWSIVGNKTISIENNALLVGNSPTSFCRNQPFNINFGAYGVFNAGNIFTAQLMNGNTVIATLGTVSGISSATISATIPSGVNLGSYEIRVISSSPSPSDFPRIPIMVVANCPPPCSSTVVLASSADDYSSGTIVKQASAANGTITATNKITGNANISYQAKSIVLDAGFKADAGVIFKVEIGGCQ